MTCGYCLELIPLINEIILKSLQNGHQKRLINKGDKPSKVYICYMENAIEQYVEAKLHDESTMIQRCFDDNNDDNKR